MTGNDDPLIGTVLEDRYEVVRLLGAGAMGAVYEVRHLRLNKRFAMKLISQALCQEPEFAARFEQEALSTSRLEHPNCIAVTDFGQSKDGLLYLVMEFLEGKPLADCLDGPLPVGIALGIARQILLGLQHAHEAGVVHRDIKPENVMVLTSGEPSGADRVKVLDFGIAKLPLAARPAGSNSNSRLTEAGVVFGTPDYMAPEQALGSADVDERADIYAAGVILWIMLTGRPLFTADNNVELLQTKLAQDPPALDRVCPGVFSPGLAEVASTSLARNPRERYATAAEFRAAVEQVLAAPGRGLATDGNGDGAGAWSNLRAAATRLGSWTRASATRVGSAYGLWYRGQPTTGERDDGASPPPAPSWATRLRALPATAPGRIVLGSALGGLLVLGLLVALLVGTGDSTAGGAGTLGSAGPAAPSKRPSAGEGDVDPATRKRLEVARQLLARYACTEAAADLRRLVADQPKLARAHYLGGVAAICSGKHREGLERYQRAIALDESYQRDKRILDDTAGLLTHRRKRTRARALAFLERLGKPALDALLSGTSSRHRDTRAKAVAAVIRLDAASRIDWLTTLHLDLKQLSCRQIRSRRTVERLAQLDDPRVPSILKRALKARTGIFGHRRRYGCVRKQIKAALARLSPAD